MSSGLPSDEVAEDYKNSLEDLAMNSRYEISNLTVIAKENTEHAMAISRVLENHIRNAPPNRKLPALYVLDSVVKNVGTPYTLFLGRNLYQTFMNAYTLVDNQIRKKLDEMLKTWKEPVPGSLDTRPVFPVEITRQIENALIKARTAAVQLQQRQAKSQQEMLARSRPTGTPPVPWRNTPTPPQGTTRRAQPASAQTNGHTYTPNASATVYSHQEAVRPSYPSQYPVQQTSTPVQPIYPPAANSSHDQQTYGRLDTLNDDIASLISSARSEFAANPYDQGIQQRLKALLDLQSILQTQKLPPDQLQMIRDQVAQLSSAARPAIAPTPLPQVVAQPQPQPQPLPPPPEANLASLFPPNALAELLASTANQARPTPPPPPPQPAVPVAPVPNSFIQAIPNAASPASGGESTLVASLRAAGILPPLNSTPTLPPAIPVTTSLPLPPQSVTPLHPVIPAAFPMPALPPTYNDVELTPSSLKIPRPHLVTALYEAQPNQCTSCGRRFVANEEGKKKKARHLDWHFRVNQRMADAAKRGQNRSWYVDEMEWIKSREDEEENPNSNASGGVGAASVTARQAPDIKTKWIRVPDDPALANAHCPICQEKFETQWNADAQDFVWMDAVKVGSRIYHASCHAEASKDGGGGGTPGRVGTPDSVLGKRKAEQNELDALRAKIKKEPVAL